MTVDRVYLNKICFAYHHLYVLFKHFKYLLHYFIKFKLFIELFITTDSIFICNSIMTYTIANIIRKLLVAFFVTIWRLLLGS